jgi:hypothetical protein
VIRRSLAAAPLLIALLALSACFGTPSATTTMPPPTAEPTATTTATATPTPAVTPVQSAAPKVALASISATVEGMALIGDDGSTIAFLDYFQPKDTAIAALTDALGFAPQELTKDGIPNSDHLASNYVDFEGLEVLGPAVDGGAGWLFRLNIVTASVRGIPITTVNGIQVGADAPALEAAYAQYARRIGTRLLVAIPGGTGYSASLFADDPNGAITRILVPAGG